MSLTTDLQNSYDSFIPSRPAFQVVIVTGYSGAGKTTVLKALEDIGFFCVDNLPSALTEAFFEHLSREGIRQSIALGIDVRSGSPDFLVRLLSRVRSSMSVRVMFVMAHDHELVKRFQETRRRHPLMQGCDLYQALEREKKILEPLKEMADHSIDTGDFTIHQLRALVHAMFADHESVLVVSLISFGFKYGTPRECNFVYDVRSLPNPHFIPALKHATGLESSVREYLFGQESVRLYWHKLCDFFLYSIQQALKEGRSFMHVAIGCTGGQHRSVALVQELAKQRIDRVVFVVQHRDVGKGKDDRGSKTN